MTQLNLKGVVVGALGIKEIEDAVAASQIVNKKSTNVTLTLYSHWLVSIWSTD
jgi:hypothetical protein